MDKNGNIIRHPGKVTAEQREKILRQRGLVVWFTGLSGAGKSTIAVEVEKKLADAGYAAYLLDGDNIRQGINADLGFSEGDRNENIRRISEIAALFRDAGMITLVSFISPFRAMRAYARERAGEGNFVEVYVKTSLAVCMERDPKGLYRKEIPDFTGKDSRYEEPEEPELLLDTERMSVEECVEMVWQEIIRREGTAWRRK